MKTHEFEGQQFTIAEIRKAVPAMSEQAIRNAIKAGRNTKVAMLSFDYRAAASAGARKSYAARGKPSHMAMVINAERNR